MEITWHDAILRVLAEEERAMHYSEIAELILSKGYYQTSGATPNNAVNTKITTSIRELGDQSPFLRVDKGIYSLRDAPLLNLNPSTETVVTPESHKPVGDEETTSHAPRSDASDESVIRAFGMYWQRDLAIWKNIPKNYVKQQASSDPIDFSEQRGVYILYDHHTVIYVGRSVDTPLGQRLFEHTKDRMGGR